MDLSLRRNYPAHGMMPGQDDAAMIDLGGKLAGLIGDSQVGPLHQCASAGRTPVRGGLQAQHGVALAANSLHT